MARLEIDGQSSRLPPTAGGLASATGLFILFAALWFVVQGQRYTVGSFLGASSLAGDLGITAAAAGLLGAVYYPAYGLMQIPAGLLADRGSPKGTLMSASILIVIASLVFALAPSFTIALLARVAVGICSGLFLMSMLKMCSERARADRYGRFVAGLFGIGNVGAFVSMAALPLLLVLLDWRWSTVASVIPIAIFPFFLLFIPSRPGPVGCASEVPRADHGEDARHAAQAAATPLRSTVRVIVGDLRRILINRPFWVTCLPLIAWQGVNFGLLNWLPRYCYEVLHMDRAATGVLPSLIVLGFAAAGAAGGWLHSRFRASAKQVIFAICILHAVALSTLVLFGSALAGSWPLLYALVFLLGLTFSAYVLAMALVRDVMPLELLGTASGALNSIPFLGSFFYTWGMGFLMDAIDQPDSANWVYSERAYATAFLLAAGSYALMLVAALLLDRMPKGKPLDTSPG